MGQEKGPAVPEEYICSLKSGSPSEARSTSICVHIPVDEDIATADARPVDEIHASVEMGRPVYCVVMSQWLRA